MWKTKNSRPVYVRILVLADAKPHSITEGNRSPSHAVESAEGEPITILYLQMDATGVPVVKAETENADQYFPGAKQIVDLYHAREHLWDLARVPARLSHPMPQYRS
jgi:hypothetical protein